MNEEALNSGKAAWSIFMTKLLKLIAGILLSLFDFFLIFIFSPLYLVLSLFIWIRSLLVKKKNKIAYFVGLEHVIDKTTERGQKLEQEGYQCYYFSFESTGRKCNPNYQPIIRKYSALRCIDTFTFIVYVLKENPAYLEIYFEGEGYRQLLCAGIGKINNSLVISIDRGFWFGYINSHETPLTVFYFLNTYRLSDYVFSREIDEKEAYAIFKKYVSFDKLYFDFNRVKIGAEPDYSKKDPRSVLFLNSFCSARRAELLIKAIPKVLEKYADVKFSFIGGRSEEEMTFLNNLIQEYNIGKNTNAQTWTETPKLFFETSSIYVLPADNVFCNFSLLEAMERGLPVVVSNVKSADKIVDHGVNGFLCGQNEDEIASYILLLLEDQELRLRMGKAARKKMIGEFDSSARMQPVLNMLNERIRKNELS